MGFRKTNQTAENLPRSLPGSVQMDLWCQAQAGFYRVHEAVWLQHYHEISTWSEGRQHLHELSSIIWILNCLAIQKISVSVQSAIQWPVLNYKVRKLPKNTTCVEGRREEILLSSLLSVRTATDYEQDWFWLLRDHWHFWHISFELIQGTVWWCNLWDKL